jgi:hypothetical protein
MTDPELRQAFDALAGLLRPWLDRSEPLRSAVGAIGRWLVAESERASVGGQDAGAARTPGSPAQVVPPAEALASTAGEQSTAERLAPHTASPRHERWAIESNLGAAASSTPQGLKGTNGEGAPTPSPGPTEVRGAATSSGYVPLRLGDSGIHHLRLAGTTEELGRARQAAQQLDVEAPLEAAEFEDAAQADFPLIERRCRLKARACRHYIRRRAAPQGSQAEREAGESINEMISAAKQMPHCFLWVFWRERSQPADQPLELIAENYDALADAAALLGKLGAPEGLEGSEFQRPALEAVAEAHSALRVALSATWLVHDDRDQIEIHRWLKHWTATRRIFLHRHMSLADPADPRLAAQLRVRIAELSREVDETRSKGKAMAKALGRIRFHAGKLLDALDEELDQHWKRIGAALETLRELSVPATDRRVTDAIGAGAAGRWTPAHEEWVPAAIIERARSASRGSAAAHGGDGPGHGALSAPRAWDEIVLRVRPLLAGGHAVVIGGIRKGRALDRLKAAFELATIEWVALAEHGPSTPMYAAIRRRETRIVLVIVKLTGHLHAETARQLATEAAKPCVLIRGGYGPNSVAAAILEQASGRLSA